ncbi:30S ribosomal protein S15 [Mycoplasmoides pneumoniae]|uniref:30S ribosomal protein S15 n=1 Tax=Mycoplasmoides pneumoniae TaxID=2104 RepID=UPI000A2A1443|nr:30S ribosomal protein S15 [Mycoplasmoides pneumoniae]ARQ34064.1 30S ribosomal protein S15 [Mycoplasmoides pneumoniae]
MQIDKNGIIKSAQLHDKDVGSIQVQVSLLTSQIKQLTDHLLANKKDFISKRGLYAKVSKRKRLLKYFKHNDLEAYRNLVKTLNLRG